jgi:hypothetical protein
MNYATPQPLTIETAVKRCRVLGTVEGKVVKIIVNGDASRTYGFELAETITNPNNGASWDRIWTVWDDQAAKYKLDQLLIVTGDVSFKYERYTRDGEDFEREVIKGAINNAHVKTAFTSTEAEPF